MADSGVRFNTTQGRDGHATARITMELYSHRTTAANRAAADVLEAHFGPAFSDQYVFLLTLPWSLAARAGGRVAIHAGALINGTLLATLSGWRARRRWPTPTS